jgi:peptidoglycan/xylan/chitin deacetylase (PgdA/CDA1 family)
VRWRAGSRAALEAGSRTLIGAAVALALALVLVVAAAAGPAPVRAAEPGAGEPAAIAPGLAPRVVWRGPRKDRVVALTFDDGWNAKTLQSIYRTLVREKVSATFFVTGMYIQRAPDLWREIGARFPIANHSNRHRDTRSLGDAAVVADLIRTRSTVERATGRPMLPFFRPPYGYRNVRTDRLAAAAGFPTIVMWDATATDTVPRPTVRGVVRSASTGRPGSIVLLHAGPRVTARALPAIIARYRARGFRFVTLPELIGVRWSAAGRPVARALDGVSAVATVDSPAPAVPPTAGGDLEPVVDVPAPAAPVPTAAPAPARDRAWARSDGTPGALAAGTGAVLVLLLLVAAAAGRGRQREDETPL